MSIAITTMTGENYGSVLQGYALQRVFAEQGNVETHTIGIHPKSRMLQFLRKYILPGHGQNAQVRMQKLYSDWKNQKKDRKIRKFYFENLTMRYYKSWEKLNGGEADTHVFVCGSDQIWNPQFQNSPLFYLTFVKSENAVKFSYAASLAVDKVSEEAARIYQKRLSDFKEISVREYTGKKILEGCMEKREVRVDADPVLLLTEEQWREKVSRRFEGEKYIFVYMLRPQPELLEYAVEMGNRYDLPVYYIGDFYYRRKGITTLTDTGVEDFLSVIANASFVVTNSFHATVFSVIFHKHFFSRAVERTGSRVSDFLYEVGLQERLLNLQYIPENLSEEMDFLDADRCIQEKRNASIAYIKRIAAVEKGETYVSENA